MAIKPPRVRHGDTIGIIAPSGPVVRKKLERGIRYLLSFGYNVHIGRHVYEADAYLAGSDSDRLDDLHAAFSDPGIKAVVLARGGYGSLRLLKKIDYARIKENPKILVGFSDATALQLAILKKAHVVTFSGPMAAVDFGVEPINRTAENHFWAVVQKDERARMLSSFNTGSIEILHEGKARGTLICGCLSVIVSCLGTPYSPDFRGAVLVLEDVSEEPYRLDRAVMTLLLHGVFDSISGLVVGQFVRCHASRKRDSRISFREIIEPIVKEKKVPAIMNFSYGHIPEKITLPMGVQAEFDTKDKKFVLVEDAVE